MASHRSGPDVAGGIVTADDARGDVRSLVYLGVWFGVAAGLVEVGVRTAQLLTGGRTSLSHQFVWMAPLADAVLFGAVGAAVAGLALLWPRRIGIGALVFPCVFAFVAAPLHFFQRLHPVAVLLVAAGVAYQSARWAQAHRGFLDRLARRTFVPLVAIVLLLAAGLNGRHVLDERRSVAALPEARAGAPNIVLVILDTVRAASLRLYGYHRATTPNLDRLAARSLIFDWAVSTAPWTLPAHGSLFTGHYPDSLQANWRAPLSDDKPVLAEVLADHGYRTAGFTGNLLYTTTETGLHRGFSRYVDYPISAGTIASSAFPTRWLAIELKKLAGSKSRLVGRNVRQVNAALFRWLDDAAGGDRPWFAFVNYFDAHDPYLPPPPFDTLFGGIEPLELSFFEPYTQAELREFQDAYDAAIASVDAALGVLVDALERRGELDNTIVVVTSDHGEHFGEHGLLYHANSLYMPLLHVPLVVWRPDTDDGGRRVPEPVTLADVPATLLELAGVADARIPGSPLVRRDGDGASRPVRSFVRETINMAEWLPASRGDMASATAGSLHYIRNGDGTEELYDYRADPLETRDLRSSAELQDELQALRAQVENGATERRSVAGRTETGGQS